MGSGRYVTVQITCPVKGDGQVCKQSLSDLAYDHTARIDWNKLDKYGRIIGKVLINNQDVSLEQVRLGCGWHHKKYQNEQSLDDRLSYGRAEEAARASRVGLWRDVGAVPPWEWRKAHRK